MGSRYRKQEDARLEISGGDWLLVRKHLTAGEQRASHARLFKSGTIKPGQPPEVDLEEVGIATAVCYLIDWSITDADDQPIRIRDQPYEFVAAALRNQTPESLLEIVQTIEAHDKAMTAAREEEKKILAGASAPDPTSTSAA